MSLVFSKVNARFGAGLGAEIFVLGQLMEADEFGAVERLAVDGAFALHADATPAPLSLMVHLRRDRR